MRNLSRPGVERTGGSVVEETVDTIVVRALNAFYLALEKNDVSLTPSLTSKFYWEPWITSWFTHNIQEGMNVMDVGANCGYYTMLSEVLGANVTAYEPSARYCELLEYTHRLNDAKFNIRPYAVSDVSGDTVLTFPGHYTGSASIAHGFDPHWGEEHHEVVRTVTLDEEVVSGRAPMPDLIKLDVESAEELVWNGAMQVLDSAPIVVLEYSPTGVYTTNFDTALFNYGTVTRINHDGREELITPEYLKTLTDWDMLVIRKKS